MSNTIWVSLSRCGRTARLRKARKSAPLRGGFALADDLAGAYVHRSEEVAGAVPDVVVGAFLRLVEGHRQDRLGPVQRLDLGLLIQTENDGSAGRVEIQADNVGNLGFKLWIFADFERSLVGAVGDCVLATFWPRNGARPPLLWSILCRRSSLGLASATTRSPLAETSGTAPQSSI